MNNRPGSNKFESLHEYIHSMEWRISPDTIRIYVESMNALLRHANTSSKTLGPNEMVELFRQVAEAEKLSHSTLRLYKASLMFYLGSEAQYSLELRRDVSPFERAFKELNSINLAAQDLNRKSSAQIRKCFPGEVVNALEQVFVRTRSRALDRLLCFLKSNLLLGLRPNEWLSARPATYIVCTDSGQRAAVPMLVITNSKNSYGRANGDEREILMHGLSAQAAAEITRFLEYVQKYEHRCSLHGRHHNRRTISGRLFNALHKKLRKELSKAGFEPGDIPSLYDTRHQSIADCKASGMEPIEIAAMFGHISDSTQKKYYGQKKHGGRTVTFRPSPHCLAQTKAKREALRLAREHSRDEIPDVRDIASMWVSGPNKSY